MQAARRVAILIFDGVEVLDFAGPFEAFSVTGWTRPPLPFDVYTVARSERAVLPHQQLFHLLLHHSIDGFFQFFLIQSSHT